MLTTVKPRYNDPRYNDKYAMSRQKLQYSKMYGTEPRYNDTSMYNDLILLLPWHIVISGFHW